MTWQKNICELLVVGILLISGICLGEQGQCYKGGNTLGFQLPPGFQTDPDTTLARWECFYQTDYGNGLMEYNIPSEGADPTQDTSLWIELDTTNNKVYARDSSSPYVDVSSQAMDMLSDAKANSDLQYNQEIAAVQNNSPYLASYQAYYNMASSMYNLLGNIARNSQNSQ